MFSHIKRLKVSNSPVISVQDGWMMGGWIEGWMDGWIMGWMDGSEILTEKSNLGLSSGCVLRFVPRFVLRFVLRFVPRLCPLQHQNESTRPPEPCRILSSAHGTVLPSPAFLVSLSRRKNV